LQLSLDIVDLVARMLLTAILLGAACSSRMARSVKGSNGRKGSKGRMMSGNTWGDTNLTFGFGGVTVSVGGCQCTGRCKTNVGSYFNCDICRVLKSCPTAKYSFIHRHHYDFCAWPEVPDWEAQSATAKLNALWTQIQKGGEEAEPASMFEIVKNMVTFSMRPPFDTARDVIGRIKPRQINFEASRTKVIHAVGAVCQVDMEITSNAFSGNLATGQHRGLLRMGGAIPVKDDGEVLPGLALKVLRDGMTSANMFAIRGAGEGTSGNFFEGALTNHVSPPSALVKLNKFQQASDCISMIGLSNFAKYNSNGTKASNLDFPYEIRWESPTPDLVKFNKSSSDYSEDLLSNLAGIPKGTKLFDLQASSAPGGAFSKLGTVTTASECIRGGFGDTGLHFQHQRVEEDFQLKSEWVSTLKTMDTGVCNVGQKSVTEWQCGKEKTSRSKGRKGKGRKGKGI